MFTDAFIENLSADPITGVLEICNVFFEAHGTELRGVPKHVDEYIEAYALLASYADTNQIPVQIANLPINTEAGQIINFICEAFTVVLKDFGSRQATTHFEKTKERIAAKLPKTFVYEFSEGDLTRIQELINELREQITSFEGFEEDHKARILKRLERLQSELHKRVTDVDRFWGLIGDAGVVLKKFGDDAKPIVDRITELANIAWRAQAHAEQLPSSMINAPLLKHKDDQS